MYFITTKRMLEVCFSAHPNIQYRTLIFFCMQSEGVAQSSILMILRHPLVLFTLYPWQNKRQQPNTLLPFMF